MSFFKLTNLTIIAVMGFGGSMLAIAQDAPENTPPENNGTVADNIADRFSDFLGDNSGPLVNALRRGDNLDFGEPGDITTVDNTVGPMGFGEISIALGLAESLAVPGAPPQDMADLFHNTDGTGILDMRADDMGWGQIFNANGTTVGAVISRRNRNEMAQSRRANPENRPENRSERRNERSINRQNTSGDRAERPERGDFPDRPDRPDRRDRPERPERPEIADRPDRPERPDLP
ncbi:MAG: hypothetical protein JKY98_07050, partial [Gammaproteobacteria bacterium]|nr:hypothetical protein [Gammaproteobacteria bacterium]